eukprot:jgi/Botrbrau1/17192/Bobra.0157s0081.1
MGGSPRGPPTRGGHAMAVVKNRLIVVYGGARRTRHAVRRRLDLRQPESQPPDGWKCIPAGRNSESLPGLSGATMSASMSGETSTFLWERYGSTVLPQVIIAETYFSSIAVSLLPLVTKVEGA